MQGESDGRVIDEERNHDSPSFNAPLILGYPVLNVKERDHNTMEEVQTQDLRAVRAIGKVVSGHSQVCRTC